MARRIINHSEVITSKQGQWLKKATERWHFEEDFCGKWVRTGYKHSAKKQQKRAIREIGKAYIKRGDWN